jgi:hypothetical protein
MGLGDGVIWNEALPDDNTVANQIDDYNRDLRVGVRARMAQEHFWGSAQTGTSEGGLHKYVTLQALTAAPTLVVYTSLTGTNTAPGGGLYVATNPAVIIATVSGTANVLTTATSVVPYFIASSSTSYGIVLAGTNTSVGAYTLALPPLVVSGTQGEPIDDNMLVRRSSVKTYGRILQVVNIETGALVTGSTIMPADDSIPQKTEGIEVMTLAITPTSATNKLKIEVVCCMGNASADNALTAALFQDDTANALAAILEDTYNDGNFAHTVHFIHYMTAGTTSATTFKVRAGSDLSGTVYFNGAGVTTARLLGGVMASSITITEIAA